MPKPQRAPHNYNVNAIHGSVYPGSEKTGTEGDVEEYDDAEQSGDGTTWP